MRLPCREILRVCRGPGNDWGRRESHRSTGRSAQAGGPGRSAAEIQGDLRSRAAGLAGQHETPFQISIRERCGRSHLHLPANDPGAAASADARPTGIGRVVTRVEEGLQDGLPLGHAQLEAECPQGRRALPEEDWQLLDLCRDCGWSPAIPICSVEHHLLVRCR